MEISAVKPPFNGIQIGIGTWQWGDRIYWEYGKDYQEEDILAAIEACFQFGLNFFDTAEVYGMGLSERIIGKALNKSKKEAFIASKFMPFPWRLSRRSLLAALKNTIKRLNVERLDLYQLHFPFPPINIETWMEAMAEAHQAGLIKEIGLSNCNAEQLQRAFDMLVHHGIRLASLQIEYNLLNRTAEKTGLIRLCEQLGVAVISYSPLSQGILTGKYHPDGVPKGARGRRFGQRLVKNTQGLINAMKIIGSSHGGKNCTQVALNWLIQKGTIPIPGVKHPYQVREISESIGWELSTEEIDQLDLLSDQIQSERTD